VSARVEDLVEVLCISYNRADDLDCTLTQLRESPFAACRITVLDNASSDDTPKVCAAHEARLPHLRTVRHRRNVGVSANYLRAVELATAPYTWIICDDDTYDFTRFGDVLEALVSESYDLISLGAASDHRWAAGVAGTTVELRETEPGFHFVHSFVPSLIFRTELFETSEIIAGYMAAHTLFPHFPFLTACATTPRSIYVAREQVLFRNEGQNTLTGLRFFTLWLGACATIEDPRLRHQVVYETFWLNEPGCRRRFLGFVAGAIAFERLEHPERLVSELETILRAASPEQRLLLLGLLPLALPPRGVYRAVRRRRHRGFGAGAQQFSGDLDPLRL